MIQPSIVHVLNLALIILLKIDFAVAQYNTETVRQQMEVSQFALGILYNKRTTLQGLCQSLKERNDPSVLNKLRKCADDYKSITAKKKIQISYHIGYLDAGENTLDGYHREALIQTLTAPCPKDGPQKICDFKQDPANQDRLTRNVVWPDGSVKEIEMFVRSSSVNSADAENRSATDRNIPTAAQSLRSKAATEEFSNAMSTSDLIFYWGHSRAGGGPDFSLTQKGASDSHTDYSYYQANRPGFKLMMNSLKRRSDQPFMVGLLSCDSKKHFRSSLENAGRGPRFTLTASEVLMQNEGYKSALAAIDSTLNGVCDLTSRDLMDQHLELKQSPPKQRKRQSSDFNCPK